MMAYSVYVWAFNLCSCCCDLLANPPVARISSCITVLIWNGGRQMCFVSVKFKQVTQTHVYIICCNNNFLNKIADIDSQEYGGLGRQKKSCTINCEPLRTSDINIRHTSNLTVFCPINRLGVMSGNIYIIEWHWIIWQTLCNTLWSIFFFANSVFFCLSLKSWDSGKYFLKRKLCWWGKNYVWSSI